MTDKKTSPWAYVWMVGAMASFASMGALSRGLRHEFGWELIAFARTIVILSASYVVATAAGVKLTIAGSRVLWIRSLAGTVSMLAIFYSFTRLPVAIVVTLMNLSPAWVALLSWPLLKHKVGKGVWLAIVVGLVGVVLIQRPELAQHHFAVLVPFVASFIVAIVMLSLHYLRAMDHRVVVFHFALVSMIACAVVTLTSSLRATPMISHEPVAWLMLIGVGLTSTIGQYLLTLAFAFGQPAQISVVALTQVGFAMFYDILIWGHQFGWTSLLGIALVLAPTAWLLVRERRGDAGL